MGVVGVFVVVFDSAFAVLCDSAVAVVCVVCVTVEEVCAEQRTADIVVAGEQLPLV